jgi:hypothetical protein
MIGSHTETDVAKWMLDALEKTGRLYQQDVAWQIEKNFGRKFVTHDNNGNPVISKKVLQRFRQATVSHIVWARKEKCWRPRVATDRPGRLQE